MNLQKGIAPLISILIGLIVVAGFGFMFISFPSDPTSKSEEPAEETTEVGSAIIPKSESISEVSKTSPPGTSDSEDVVNEEVPDVPTQTENSLLAILEGEIDRLIEDGLLIGIDHYEKLRARLDALTGTEDKGVIARVDEKLIFVIEPEELAINTSSPGAPERTCVSNTNPVFTHDITDVWRISQITPPGNISSDGGVTSHSYIDIADGKQVPVYAPVDMRLGNGAFYIENGLLGYILWFQVSCEVTIKFDHIAEPVDAIRIAFPSVPQSGTRDNILNEDGNAVLKAGDLIGHTSGTSEAHNWDFGVYNTSIFPNPVTSGIANLDDLDKGADCGYDYFSSELRQAYRDLFVYDASMGSLGIIPYCSI